MTRHPREEATTKACTDLQFNLSYLSGKYSLTPAEVLRILAQVLDFWTKRALQAERERQ